MVATRPRHIALAAAAALCVTVYAAGTHAADRPAAVSIAEVDGTTRILVAYPDGVVTFDAQGEPYHAYAFSPGKKGHHALADVNADGKLDYVALGPKSTFVIDASGDPIWAADGCDLSRLGNIAGDDALEVFCVDGRAMRVWASDGTIVWEMEISGMSFGDCRLVDLRGAGMGDIECQLKGKKMWLQVSGEGSLIEEAASAPADDALAYALPAPAFDALAGDEALLDFNGDGTAEEYLVLEGGDVIVHSKSAGKPLAAVTMTPAAATVGNLDDDAAKEVVLAGSGRLVALDRDADKTVRFDTAFERKKLKREPTIEFATIGTYGLAGDREVLRELLAPAAESLAACYTARLKKDDFLKVGRLSVRAMVGPGGKVDKIEQSFSTLGDPDVEACVKKVIGGLTLLSPEEGADSSYASIDLVFGYRDR